MPEPPAALPTASAFGALDSPEFFGVALGEALGLALGEALGDAFGLGLGLAFGEGLGEGFGLFLGEGLGLGLGVGSRFTRLMNDSLPGHAIQFRQFGSKLAVSRVSFGPNFFSCRSSNIRSSGAIKVSVFSENNSLVGFVSREAPKNDVPINIYPLSDLSEQLQIEIAAGASSLDSLFLVEICQGYLGARDFFGDDLYISMTDFGRFVFISDSDLDSTYQELGVIARFPVGVEGIFNRFAL